MIMISVIYSAAMLNYYSKIVFLIISCLHVASFVPDRDSYKPPVDLMKAQGYPVEIYNITTPDFYILQIYRIPSGRNNQTPQPNPKTPVLLLHGIFCSAAEFSNNFAGESLAYVLADAQFDVWLINFRGNAYSHTNIKIPSSSQQFWDFSFDEMATYDLPTFMDFVINKTGHEQVYLIGHSMGTTVPLAMLSEHPEYNSKVKTFFGLGTTIYLRYSRGIIPLLEGSGGILSILNGLTNGEAFPQATWWTTLVNTVCTGPLVLICELGLQYLLGDQPGCLNRTRIPVYLSHFPAGTSIRTVIHFFQVINSQSFRKYDFGYQENLKRYNQATPPVYDMSNVIAPVHLYYIDGDYFTERKDTELVASKLGTAAQVHRLVLGGCGHIWLVWGKEIAQNGYQDIIAIMNAG